MRARFERSSSNPRPRLQRKFPNLVFGDHSADGLPIQSVWALRSPTPVIVYLHDGVFFMGSRASYHNQAMRLSYRFDAEVFVPAYRLSPEPPRPAALDDALAAWSYPRTVDTPNMDKTSCDETPPLSMRLVSVCIFNCGHAPFAFHSRQCCIVTAMSAAQCCANTTMR